MTAPSARDDSERAGDADATLGFGGNLLVIAILGLMVFALLNSVPRYDYTGPGDVRDEAEYKEIMDALAVARRRLESDLCAGSRFWKSAYRFSLAGGRPFAVAAWVPDGSEIFVHAALEIRLDTGNLSIRRPTSWFSDAMDVILSDDDSVSDTERKVALLQLLEGLRKELAEHHSRQ